jgi:hypothetical protein
VNAGQRLDQAEQAGVKNYPMEQKNQKKSSLRLAYSKATLGFHLLLFPALQHGNIVKM